MSTIKADAVTAVSTNADLSLDGLGTGGVSIASTLKMAKGGDISSASPLVIDTDGNYFDVTGTTNFAAMTVEAGNFFMLQFDGALTITHGSGIEIPGAANLTTAAGDRLMCYATAANTVEVMSVQTEAASSGGMQSMQVFVSSGTWTKPSGVASVQVTVTGSGGGGGGGGSTNTGGGGGGAGGTAIEFIDVSGTSSETVTIGAAGAAGSSGGGDGGAGNTSSFGSLCTATGGAAGIGNTTTELTHGGIGGAGSGGDINIAGGGGSNGAHIVSKAAGVGGIGGASYLGGGGRGSASLLGVTGSYGGGGSGGARDAADTAGGAGGVGAVIVQEYG